MFITVTHCSIQRVKRVLVEKYVQGHRRMEAWLEHCRLCPFKRGATGAEVPFHNSVIGKFMVYQDRLEINLLQLFGHPDRIIFYISISIFEVNIVVEQKHTWLVTIFCFLQVSIALNSFTTLPAATPAAELDYAYCVNKLRQNVGLQTWIWRHIVTSQYIQ